MKQYKGSISMTGSERLKILLKDTLEQERISYALETGTYKGLGSTTFISESFPKSYPPEIFVTIEINWFSWRKAKRNLRRFPFVKPVWGRTVALEKALEFIKTDDLLRNHNVYPNLFIDNTKDPIKFYSNEISGFLGGRMRRLKDLPLLPFRFFDRVFRYEGDNLLERYLQMFQSRNPLVILDSAGGIGFLEFSIVEQVMQNHSYLLLLDDIHHLKHFRSYQRIKDNPHFQMIEADEAEGWLLAKHK